MLEGLLKCAEIRDYLNLFPRNDWQQCLEVTIRVGIREIRSYMDTKNEQVARKGKNYEAGQQALREKMNALRVELDNLRKNMGEDVSVRRHTSPGKTLPRRTRTKSKPSKKTLRQQETLESLFGSETARTTASPPVLKSPELPVSVAAVPPWSGKVSLRLQEPKTNLDMFSSLSSDLPVSETSPFLAIADEFLSNPLVSELATSTFS